MLLINLSDNILLFFRKVSVAVLGDDFRPVLVQCLDESILDLEHIVDKIFVLVDFLVEQRG